MAGPMSDCRAVGCRIAVHAAEAPHRPLQHLLRLSSVEDQPPNPHDRHQLRHHVALHSSADALDLHRTPSRCLFTVFFRRQKVTQ